MPLLAVAFVLAATVQALPAAVPGRLVDGVACSGDRSQTYALFLPSNYTPTRRWPLLFVFDPRSRGAAAATIFRDAAEMQGWIIASSNNTRSDGPPEPNQRAIGAMWADVMTRFPIDPRRVYAAGFSGGGGLAWALARGSQRLAGVISVGAPDPGAESGPPFSAAWFGAAGLHDFNYLHVKAVHDRLAKDDVPRRLEFFDGAHQWLPAAMAARAVAWLEVLAMRSGAARPEEEKAVRLYEADLGEGRALEAAGRLPDALRLYAAAADALRGQLDVTPIVERMRALEEDPALARRRKEEERAERSERARTGSLGAVLTRLYEPEQPDLPHMRAALRLEALRREAGGAGPAAAAARRSLELIFVQTSYYLPGDFAGRERYARAALALELAASIHADRPRVWHDLAAAYAMSGSRREALRALTRAVDLGLSGRERVAADGRFRTLAADDAFKALLQRMR